MKQQLSVNLDIAIQLQEPHKIGWWATLQLANSHLLTITIGD